MSNLTIMIVAFFIGNATPMKDAYIFEEPTYESVESCLEAIDENYHFINYYLSMEFGHTTRLYHNKFYCTSSKEVQKLLKDQAGEKHNI